MPSSVWAHVSDKGENASLAAQNVIGPYVTETTTVNHSYFWFRRSRSDKFDVKDDPRFGSRIVENVYKIRKIVESDSQASTLSIAHKVRVAQNNILEILY